MPRLASHAVCKAISRLLALACLAVPFLMSGAHAQSGPPPIRFGYVDPLSGAFAQQGDASLKMFAYVIDRINAKGGALGRKFEIVPFDSKLQPAEALIALKAITDQNLPFFMHCAGSNVAAALVDGVAKHNARNPTNRVLYFNCGALASDLTNEQCNFWHFRFDGHTGMRAAALVHALPKEVTSVYLMNQDYLFGQVLQRETKEWLAKLRPDIKIVGEELIPLGKVKDFSPYITKIKALNPQVLITGNWGPDVNLLLKAASELGLEAQFYTYLSHVVGGVTAAGPAAENRLFSVSEFHPNAPVEENNAEGERFVTEWRKNHDFDLFQINVMTMFEMVVDAINKAGSLDPLKIALALEDMKKKDFMGHDNLMRKDDHQMIESFYVSQLVRGVKYDSEKTGLGWRTQSRTDAANLMQPHSCKMQRPTN